MITNMPLKYAMGATIRKLRQERDLNLKELSKLSHVSFVHISDIERGATSAGFDIIQAIAGGLNITTHQLVKEIYEYLEEVTID